jgi:hypothetical protein
MHPAFYWSFFITGNTGVRGDIDNREDNVQSKLQQTASFIVVESLDVPPEHTHTFTSCPLPWYFRKNRVDNIFFSSFNHALPKIQSQTSIALLLGRSWFAKMHRATNVSYYAGQPISILSHNTRKIPPHVTYLQQRLLSGGPKAEWAERTLTCRC